MKVEIGDIVVHKRYGCAKVVKKFVNEAGEMLYKIDPSGLGYNGYYMVEIFASVDELFMEVTDGTVI